MEKAKDKVQDVRVEMVDGTSKTLSTLAKGDLASVKNDGKEENGKATSITLKRGVVSDNGKVYVERRLFKYSNMKEPAMYDLTLPLVETEFNKIAFDERLNLFCKAKRIDADHEQVGGEALPQETKDVISILKKDAKGEKLTKDELSLLKTYMAMKSAGFGK